MLIHWLYMFTHTVARCCASMCMLWPLRLSVTSQSSETLFTQYSRLSNRLYNRFDKHGLTTVLNEQPLFVQLVVKPGGTTGLTTSYIHDTAGCHTGCTTGLITGCIV